MRELMNFTGELALIEKDIVALDEPSRFDDRLFTWTSPLTKGHNLCCRRD
jgi:hypothetical protein